MILFALSLRIFMKMCRNYFLQISEDFVTDLRHSIIYSILPLSKQQTFLNLTIKDGSLSKLFDL